MRARFFHVTMIASALGAAAACATSDDVPSSPEESPTLDDGGSGTADASVDAAVLPDATAPDAPSAPTCSPAGWCITELPDPSLELKDIWPFEKRAFAVGISQYAGPKVLEWNEDVSQQSGWKYIDDNTQQDLYRGELGNIWAPNEDEVYYTLRGETRGGYLYHGKRPTPPATEWTWTRTPFQCAHPLDTPAVWGSGGDVYALSCSKIYRLTGDPDAAPGVAGDGGSSPWTLEYTDDDPTPIVFFGGGGTADDTLFIGARGYLMPCAIIVRKTANGYQRVVDGSPVSTLSTSCKVKPGYPMVPGLYGFSSTRPGEVLGTLLFQEKLLKVAIDGEGKASITEANPQPPMSKAVWSGSPDEVWLGAGYLMHGTGMWSDGGSYQVSTVALNDGRPVASFAKIRGISNSNLWAVGTRAYHKTTP